MKAQKPANIDFAKAGGLVPALVQDNQTGEVYMVGYMNQEAFNKTNESGWVHFWSRSKNRLWMKGEESDNKLKVVSIYEDCDQDALLVKVDLKGTAVCHTGNKSCFFTEVK